MQLPCARISLLVLFFLFLSQSFVLGQAEAHTYEDSPLSTIFQELEKVSGRSINFDSDRIRPYSFTGSLNLTQLEPTLTELLATTPFTFELLQTSILIFEAPRKSYRICGTLLNREDKSPLAFATLTLFGTKLGAQTDQWGNFDFNIEASSNQQIKLSYLGYANESLSIETWKDSSCQTISLAPEALSLGPILIQDYILPGITEGTSYGSVEVNFMRLSQSYSGQEHDILKTVQILPGVTSIDETAANLTIRGSTPDQNLLVWEGATLYDPGHIFGMISSISPFVVDKVNVYKGVFAPKFEDRIGGVVDISLSDSIPHKIRGGMGSSFTEAHAYVETPLIPHKLSLLLSGRNNLSTLFNSPPLTAYTERIFQATRVEEGQIEEEEGAGEAEQRLTYHDFNAKLLFRPSDRWLIKGTLLRIQNNFFYSFLWDEGRFRSEDEVSYKMDALGTEVQYSWNERFRSSLSFVQSSFENDIKGSWFEFEDSLFNFNFSSFNSIRDQKLNFSNQLTLLPELTIGLGYQYDRKEVNFRFEEEARFEEDISNEEEEIGNFHTLYASASFLSKNVQLDGGIRATFNQQAETWLYSPRASIQLALGPTVKLKASAGQLYQFISQLKDLEGDDLSSITNIWILTDPEEDFLRARKFSVGGIYVHNGWLVDIDGYYNRLSGLASFTTPIGGQLDINSNGSGETRGIDILLRKNGTNWKYGINYTLSQNEYSFPDVGPNPFPATNDIRHNLGLTQSLKFGKWELSSTYQFRSGLPFTLSEGVISSVGEEGEINYELNFNQINDRRLDAYHRIDAGATYRTLFMQDRLHAEVSFSIINLLNRENVFSRQTRLGDQEEGEIPQPVVLEKTLLGITPLLMLRFYWE